MAAVDYFLKIDGIEGESQDKGHKGEIDVLMWDWGEQNSGGSSYGGGGGQGKVVMKDFTFQMKVNKATPKLVLACASGQHIKEATLTCRKAGGSQEEFLKYYFYDLLISSYDTGGSEGADIIPTETITFNYSKMKVEYKEQKTDGTLGGAIAAGWDLKQNVKV